MNKLLTAALDYATIGWKVFPLRPGEKTPVTQHGVKDASSDPSQIAEWWARYPDANVGLSCEGAIVIDCDSGNTWDGVDKLERITGCAVQNTPRGGSHYVFRRPDDKPWKNSTSRIAKDIDTRTDGGYIVAAPSHTMAGDYSWIEVVRSLSALPPPPAWLIEELDGATSPPKPEPVTPLHKLPAVRTEGVTERASLYLGTVDPAIQGDGGHNQLLYAASRLVHGFLMSDSQAYNLLAREYNPICLPPWNLADPKEEKDFRRKVTEARRLTSNETPGWLLDDPAYAPVSHRMIDVAGLIGSAITGTPEDYDPPLAKPKPLAFPEVTHTESRSELEYLCTPTGLLGELCSWMNATAIRRQPILSLGCSLAFLGALFGQKVRDSFGGRTNLYCIGVAPSSAGKAHAMHQIRRLCNTAGASDLIGGDDLASDAAIEGRMSRHPVTLFMLDEIGHLLSFIKSGQSQFHARIISILMKLYSSAGSTYKGREYADEENQRVIIEPCCCLYGASTPERFTGGLSPENIKDGLLGRCLIFRTEDIPPKSYVRQEAPPEAIAIIVNQWFRREVNDETNGTSISQFVTLGGSQQPPKQIVVKTSDAAQSIFVKFDEETTKIGRASPMTTAAWLRCEENARRIALIVACGNSYDSPAIDKAVADYSCRLIRFIMRSFVNDIQPEIVGSKIEAEKRAVFLIIKASGKTGVVKAQITKHTQGLGRRARNEILDDLVEAEMIFRSASGNAIRHWSAENIPV